MAVKFGKYILLNKIATGGMAEVFRAKHIGVGGFEKIVAIKRILPHFSHNEEFITMFNEEAKVSAQLSHQNIVQIYEFGMVEESYYIAMEHIDGITLNDLLIYFAEQNGTIPVNLSLAIMRDACKGLDYAHRKKGFDNQPLNIVHRDISPKNIMISFDGAVKVMDFGIAKATSRDYETRTGVIKGKISYLSPEQVQGTRLDKRSDIFSIGIVFYEMLTSSKCFQGESDFSILFKIKNADIEPVTEINSDVDDEVAAITLKSLAQDREKRYQTAEEMSNAIERYLSSRNLDPAETDISLFMRNLEDDFREKMSTMQEYFPEQGEESKGEVFELGADGTIPAEIGSKILSEESSARYEVADDEVDLDAIPDHGTKVVDQSGLSYGKPKKKSNTWLLISIFLLLVVLGGVGYYAYINKILPEPFQPKLITTVPTTRPGDQGGTGQPYETPVANQKLISYTIDIRTEPQRATVSVNGEVIQNQTPITIRGEDAYGKRLTIDISKKCFTSQEKIFVLGKDEIPSRLTFELKPASLDVAIQSTPPKATFFFDDVSLGETPYTLTGVDPCKPHSLRIEKDGYETISQSQLYITEKTLSFSLVKKEVPGWLSISSTYPVTIYLSNNSQLGEVDSTGKKFRLKAGTYNLVAKNAKYCIRRSFTATVGENKTSQQNLEFGPLGYVRIISIPFSEVTVNGYPMGTTPIEKTPLPEGMYEVEWNFVSVGKKKTERLKVTRNIHKEWRGSISY